MSSSSSIHRTLPFPVDQLLILPLTSSDFLSAAQTAGAAFGYDENPFRTFVSPPSLRPKTDPNNEFYHSHTAARWKMDYFGEETKQHHMCLKIVRKGEEENVLGAAFWGLPGGPYRKIDTSDYTAEEKEAWTDIDVDHWNTLMGAYYNAKQEVMKDQAGNCLHLKILFVHPSYQSASLGKRLLQNGFAYADKHNLPVSLESSAAGRPVYERMGFVVEKIIEIPGTEMTNPFMVKWVK